MTKRLDFEASVSMTRRRLLIASAASGGMLLTGKDHCWADETDSPSTDHFWYRLAPDGPYIDSQRDNKAFGFGLGKVYLSEDNGKTWPHDAIFRDADNITFSCILKNGNILFATRTRLFLSTDNLGTYKQIVVQDIDGSDYLPHQPIDPANPGWYFHSLDGVHTWDVGGKEMLVWGNYCNVLGGAVPVNIYYSTDSGQTVKIAYSFGQSPTFQQPGAGPSDLLGNPDNPVVCRHIHCVAYNPAENAFYACTGDHDRTDSDGNNRQECHWLRGTFDAQNDLWDWKVLVSVNSNSRFKSGGINFVDGQLYWAADANGTNGTMPHDRGIFRCDPADLTDPTKHEQLFNPQYESANMIIEDGVILSAHYAPASPYATGIIFSPDMGKTWAQYDLDEFGQRSGIRFHQKNSDGWFRVDLRKGWIERGEVLYIKPKPR
ncbi:sialidase family protein [Rubripirellula lacrimiformis]|nr:sialidase family protein [Rubripirellula lacrimiformis]